VVVNWLGRETHTEGDEKWGLTCLPLTKPGGPIFIRFRPGEYDKYSMSEESEKKEGRMRVLSVCNMLEHVG